MTQAVQEAVGNRNLAFFPILRNKSQLWLCLHPNNVITEVNVGPRYVHYLAFAKTSHPEEFKEYSLPRIALGKKRFDLVTGIDLGFRFRVSRPVALADQFSNSVRLEHGDDNLHLSPDRAAGKASVGQKAHETHDVRSFDTAKRFFTTRLAEIFEGRLVLAVRFRPVVLAGFLEELAASFSQGRSGLLVFADDFDSERLVLENLRFALCNGKRLAWILAH